MKEHLIIDVLCKELNLNQQVFFSKRRWPEYTDARILAIKLLKIFFSDFLSDKEIEYIVKQTGYTGYVNYASKRFEELCESDRKFLSNYHRVRLRLINDHPEVLKSRFKHHVGQEGFFYPEFRSHPVKLRIIDFNPDKAMWLCETIHDSSKIYLVHDYEIF